MKTTLTFLALLLGSITFAQTIPDPGTLSLSTNHYYYENKGQIQDEQGLLHPEIKYYTEHTQPKLYLTNNMVHFVTSSVDTGDVDSVTQYRIDMQFNCTPNAESTGCATLQSHEIGQDRLNYYLPHCGTNGITDVKGYGRITYADAFPDVDVHLYSNPHGAKMYFEVLPNGDPASIQLLFSGQDSIDTLTTGELAIYLQAGSLTFPQATAYQYDAQGTIYPLSWTPQWAHDGQGNVFLQTQSYNTSLPLVIKVEETYPTAVANNTSGIEWSTYYGSDGYHEAVDVQVNNQNHAFTLSKIVASDFLGSNGEKMRALGDADVYLSMFDQGSARKWATYYGGSADDLPTELAIGPDEKFYISGTTRSTDLAFPITNNGLYKQTSHHGGVQDAFIGGFTLKDGYINWASYYGGSGNDYGMSIAIDPVFKKIFFAGHTQSTSFTTDCSISSGKMALCDTYGTGYQQHFNQGGFDGFVVEFDLEDHSLDYASLYGGNDDDFIYDITAPEGGETSVFLIGGKTLSNLASTTQPSPYLAVNNQRFPLSNPGGNAYLQTSYGGNGDGFIAYFNAHKELRWSTYFGGNKEDDFSELAIDSRDKVYAVGTTWSNQSQTSCSAINNGKIPICNSTGNAFRQSTYGGSVKDALFTRFSIGGVLEWSTYFGGNSRENEFSYVTKKSGVAIAIDDKDNVFIGGSTTQDLNYSTSTIPVKFGWGSYQQDENASELDPTMGEDGYLVMFDADNVLQWSTHYGGGCQCTSLAQSRSAEEKIYNIAIYKDKKLYLAGRTQGPITPYKCPPITTTQPYCDASLSGPHNGLLARLDVEVLATKAQEQMKVQPTLVLYPNPVTDQLSIQLPKELQNQTVTLKVIDQKGTVVQQIEKRYPFVLNVKTLPKGVYLLQATTSQTIHAGQFIK